MRLIHDLNRHLELRQPALEAPLWRYVYAGKSKPFFHPLCTPAGHVLSVYQPWDHVWHRGLWYTIKFVNDTNFWEEKDRPYGVQRVVNYPAVTHDGDAITVSSQQVWVKPDGETVIDEDRTFRYAPLDQDAYTLDFSFVLTPRIAVKLDRSPFTTWGGYGGLVFRGNRNWQKTVLTFDDGSTSDRPTPVHSKWCDLTGLIDGALDTSAGIATFDHPTNPRHPTPWYGSTGTGHYYNAAFLFNEPMTLQAGEPLKQKYRVIVHDHVIDVDRMNALYDTWTGSR